METGYKEEAMEILQDVASLFARFRTSYDISAKIAELETELYCVLDELNSYEELDEDSEWLVDNLGNFVVQIELLIDALQEFMDKIDSYD